MTKTFYALHTVLYSVIFVALCSAVLMSLLPTGATAVSDAPTARANTDQVVRALRDGSLIRLQGTSQVFEIQVNFVDTYRRYIHSSLLSATDRARVVDITSRTFFNYILSNLVIEISSNGRIVDGKVYQVRHLDSGQAYKQHLDITPEQFEAAGFRWNAIFPVVSAEFNDPYYILGDPLTATDFGMTPAVRTPDPVSTPTPEPEPTAPTNTGAQQPAQEEPTDAEQSATPQMRYYTSKHTNAKYYYPEDCSGWKQISPRNLVAFNSIDALIAEYDRSLSPSCQ